MMPMEKQGGLSGCNAAKVARDFVSESAQQYIYKPIKLAISGTLAHNLVSNQVQSPSGLCSRPQIRLVQSGAAYYSQEFEN